MRISQTTIRLAVGILLLGLSACQKSPPCFVTYQAPIAFFPDNTRLLVKDAAGVQVFNLHAMREEAFLKLPSPLNGPVVTLSPDGKILAWALDDFSIQLIRISGQKVLHTLVGHTAAVTKLRFSPAGDRLISASHDTWIKVWGMDGSLEGSFQPTGADDLPSEVLGLGISPDGALLVSVPADGPVKLWNLRDFSLAKTLGGSSGYDTSDAAFSPDGRMVAADTANGLLVWKVSDGATLLGPDPVINAMAFAYSPDGQLLAYSDAGFNNTISLVSADGARKIKTLTGHTMPVTRLVFSPDSSLLASADDQEILVWSVKDGSLLATGKTTCAERP